MPEFEEVLSDNVIFLGAGFSCDAQIPLLSNFMDKMWEYSIRGESIGIRPDDLKVIRDAIDVCNELDGYHGRVSFDNRNIEEILSMLSFDVMRKSNNRRLIVFKKAITKVIEISCNVTHNGFEDPNARTFSGSKVYHLFWISLINRFMATGKFPTIISMNYDLVLERSLYQVFYNDYYINRSKMPSNTLTIDYHLKNQNPLIHEIVVENYRTSDFIDVQSQRSCLMRADKRSGSHLNINLLKLHGSLNFNINGAREFKSYTDVDPIPDIVPPVSNKSRIDAQSEPWKAAIKSLRNTKNLIFVGYSLPSTDIYIQSFLKAALGPNQDLNQISVFDPVLWEDSESSESMRRRFDSIFSEQYRKRIDYTPCSSFADIEDGGGKTEHFIQVLSNDINTLLF